MQVWSIFYFPVSPFISIHCLWLTSSCVCFSALAIKVTVRASSAILNAYASYFPCNSVITTKTPVGLQAWLEGAETQTGSLSQWKAKSTWPCALDRPTEHITPGQQNILNSDQINFRRPWPCLTWLLVLRLSHLDNRLHSHLRSKWFCQSLFTLKTCNTSTVGMVMKV